MRRRLAARVEKTVTKLGQNVEARLVRQGFGIAAVRAWDGNIEFGTRRNAAVSIPTTFPVSGCDEGASNEEGD